MNEHLRDEVKKLWPTVRSRSLNFALAPNGGDPVLVVSKKDLNVQKFLSRMTKAKKAVDTAQIWFGTVSKDEDKFVFEYSPDESKGQVRTAAFRKALKVLGNDKALKIPALVKARIHGPGLEDELTLGDAASTKEKFGRKNDFAKLEAALKTAKDGTKSKAKREEAMRKVRASAADWLADKVDSTDDKDLRRRDDVWDIYTSAVASGGDDPTPEELRFATTMLTDRVGKLDALQRTGPPEAYAEAVDAVVADLEMFLDSALAGDDDVVIDQLLTQYRAAAQHRDRLLDPTPVVPTDANHEIAESMLGFESLIEDEADEAEIAELARTLSTLRDRCSRDGLFDQVEELSDLLEMAEGKRWCFEDTGEFERIYRIDLAQALADAGKYDGDTQALMLRGWQQQVAGEDATDPGLRIEFPVIELAYGLQMLKESHPALWDIIESALEDDGEGRGRGAVPAARRKQRLERLFADPRELRRHRQNQERIEQESREIVDEYDYGEYDALFDQTKKDTLQRTVDNAATPVQALTTLLEGEMGVALSEEHSRGDVKKLIIDSLEDMVEDGLDTLYIEHFRYDEHQDLLDEYMETGVEPGPLKDYLDAQKKRHNPGDESGAPAHKDVDLRAILRKAWEVQESTGKKVRIVGIDSMDAKADPEGDPSLWGAQRTQRMNGLADSIMKGDSGRSGKYLVLAGGEHNNSHEGGSKGVPGIGQLCGVPVMTLDGTGDPKLEWDDPERRHAAPHPGGKAVLKGARMGAAAKMDDGTILGHGMPMAMHLLVPAEATGADYSEQGLSSLSVFGARFEWWERIEWVWDFKMDDPTDAATIAQKKRDREGGSTKPWGDLYTAKPRASTYREWVNAVDAAKRGELTGPQTITVTDKPAISLVAGWFSKRVLRFRIVVTDAYGKREVTEATQVCVAENGQSVYASYTDTDGNNLLWKDPGYDDREVSATETEVRFDLEEDVPDEKWLTVKRLLDAIALGSGKPFHNKEQEFLERVIGETGTTRTLRDLQEDFIKQAYCALPVLPGSERYLELAARGGGLVVARVKGKQVLAMYYTDDQPTKDQLLVVQGGPPTYDNHQYREPGRYFVELPIERVRALIGGDR